MRRLYWHAGKAPPRIYVFVVLLALAGMALVEIFKVKIKQPYFEEKMRAAHCMQKGLDLIRVYRVQNLKKEAPIRQRLDPAGSGLIGLPISIITSSPGFLNSKRTSVNPNWAAVIVDMLKEAGVKKGDIVAMGFSGSFPALNLAALSAAEALDCKVVLITSTASSSWGANIPQFTWLDMERILFDKGVISNRSTAASLGGASDRAKDLAEEGKNMIRAAIKRNNLQFLYFRSRRKNLKARMALYQKCAEGKPIAAYINVGSGTISVGLTNEQNRFPPGLNIQAPAPALYADSILSRFARQGVPVIHMKFINHLARKYGLPLKPDRIPMPGEGKIFRETRYRYPLVVGVLIFLALALFFLLRMDFGYRIFSPRQQEGINPPEPMI